jgi:RIO kinase 2
LRLGNDLSDSEEQTEESEDESVDEHTSDNGETDDENEWRQSSMGDDMLKPTDNRNFKAYRDTNKAEKPKKPKTKGGLDEDAIKDKVTRALKSQENRQTGKHHSRRNLTKGKEKRKNKDVIKHARNGNGSIFD